MGKVKVELILVTLGIMGLSGLLFIQSKRREYAQKKSMEEEVAIERKRIEEAGNVVLFFANNFGYIARQGITKEELESLIDSGISADELSGIIANRMDSIEGMVLGGYKIDESYFPVKQTQDFRDRHTYVIGKSGSGKTTLLRNMILQDLLLGNGIGVIAPEQETITEEILPFIPEYRIDDVVYFNPADTVNPVCINPLNLEAGEDIDLKVDENLTIFKRIMGDETGPRMDEIFRQSFYALMEIPGTTLLDIPQLLDRENPHFRKHIISQLKEESTIHFWQDVYPQFPKDAHLPIINRLSRFIRPKVIRNILCQKGSLSFRELIDTGKIVLFNLSDGILGENNSQLLGQLIVSKFQLAVMSRADVPQHQRRRFYLYIDEFQTYTSTATASYDKILSRARKYRLCLILAHQQTGQIPTNLLQQIFGNVSTMISFMVSRNDAVRLSREFISEYDGEIISISPEELLSLKVGETVSKMGRNSFFMTTFPVKEKPNSFIAEKTINQSRKLFGSKSNQKVESNFVSDKQQASSKPKDEADGKAFEDIDPSEVF